MKVSADEQAKKCIELFRKQIYEGTVAESEVLNCARSHVSEIIKLLEEMQQDNAFLCSLTGEINYWKSVLLKIN